MRTALLTGSAFALLAAGAPAATAPPPAPGQETIALSAAVAKGAITLVGADGKGVRVVAVGSTTDQQLTDPAWAPSGSQLAYTSAHPARTGVRATSELWTLKVPGGIPHPLTARRPGRLDDDAAYSPTGTRIAFSRGSDGPGSGARIMIVPAAGGTPVGVTAGRLNRRNVSDTQPAWAPDGTLIAFTRRDGLKYSIWTMKPNGTGQKRIILDGSQPAWSPDGSRIAYVSGRDHHGTCGSRPCNELYMALASGGLRTRITHDTLDESAPAWAPDGSRLAIVRGSGSAAVPAVAFTLNPSGSCQLRVTGSAVSVSHPAWRPGLAPAPVTC